eukprot:COSAG06_NODE_5149_length_3678_cov_7.194188_2_plen_78_part_00
MFVYAFQLKERAELIKFLFDTGEKLAAESKLPQNVWSPSSFIDMSELYSVRNMSSIPGRDEIVRSYRLFFSIAVAAF